MFALSKMKVGLTPPIEYKPATAGESYVVEKDTSSTNNLWPGDELIITAKNLYDGKVVN